MQHIIFFNGITAYNKALFARLIKKHKFDSKNMKKIKKRVQY